ncbi:TRAP-like protein [Hymenopellis radicata]|nr:TRAP-like protein [Hymenopellis radicata]
MTGGEMSESIFTGPGEVMLAPDIWGDIVPIRLTVCSTPWSVGRDAFLACSMGVVRSTKSQGSEKRFVRHSFSGEGLFVYQITGQGILFVQSIGAIIQKHLQPGEQWIVDNGHLRIQAGGILSGAHTDEGLVCRYLHWPRTIYIQTRNAEVLGQWIADQLPARSA